MPRRFRKLLKRDLLVTSDHYQSLSISISLWLDSCHYTQCNGHNDFQTSPGGAKVFLLCSFYEFSSELQLTLLRLFRLFHKPLPLDPSSTSFVSIYNLVATCISVVHFTNISGINKNVVAHQVCGRNCREKVLSKYSGLILKIRGKNQGFTYVAVISGYFKGHLIKKNIFAYLLNIQKNCAN